MKPSPELDALVAEKVMGWSTGMCDHFGVDILSAFADDERYDEIWLPLGPEQKAIATQGPWWSPSTSMAAALEVESKIGEGYDTEEYGDHLPNKRVYDYLTELHRLVGHPIDYESSFDADWALLRATPYQRCLAALKAVGVEVPT